MGIMTPIFPPAAGAVLGALDAEEDAEGEVVVALDAQAARDAAMTSARIIARTFFIFYPP